MTRVRPRPLPQSAVAVWCLTVVALLVVTPSRARAQGGWEGRGRVSVNRLAQVATPGFSEAITLTKEIEPAPISVSSPRATLPGFDIGGAVRLWRNVGASVALSYATRADNANLTAQIPHPFYFNQPRTIAGTVSNVTHAELATHLDAVVLLPRRRLEVMVSVGMSLLRLSQDLVSDVTYADAYPYDTARFVDAITTRATVTKTGYNAAVDVSWRLSQAWGVGGLVRYVHATAPLSVNGAAAGTRKTGGVQLGGGLRVGF